MKSFVLALCLLAASAVLAQPAPYRLDNIHAHNDYDHNTPFSEAYSLGIGSIEADVLLIRDTLFVAHSRQEIKREVLFGSRYLLPLVAGIRRNNGYVYADTTRVLQLLIDIKTDSLQTLQAVIAAIQQYPELVHNRSVRFVITGNQPSPLTFSSYPSFLFFDGKIRDEAHLQQLARIGVFSANFAMYSRWKGVGEIPGADLQLIRRDVEKAHTLHRAFRFWGVPDQPEAWKQMMEIGVDYLNTDHIHDLARFLEKGR